MNSTDIADTNRYFSNMKTMTKRSLEKKVFVVEVEEVQDLIKKYDLHLNGNYNELMNKYETFYRELLGYVKEKNKIPFRQGIYKNSQQKKTNLNKVIDCVNRIIERIREKVTCVYNKRMNELDALKIDRYDVNNPSSKKPKSPKKNKTTKKTKPKQQPRKQQQQQQKQKQQEQEQEQPKQEKKQSKDEELNIIYQSMNVLTKWSNKQHNQILFDSDVDGDGGRNVLRQRVLKKDHLYFITFDDKKNVFGGYIDSKIMNTDTYVKDPKSFLFSLINKGEVKNTKYDVKRESVNNAFKILSSNTHNSLYLFANDLMVCKPKNTKSLCDQFCYEYNGEINPLTESTNFTTQRIIVLRMF
ncbi:hypothetical protein QTN25_003408 [Entamoeba marina]